MELNLEETKKDWEDNFYESDWEPDTLNYTDTEKKIIEELTTFLPRHLPVYDWNLPYADGILLIFRRHLLEAQTAKGGQAEVRVMPKIAEENFLKFFTGKIVKKEKGRFGTIHYSFIWETGDYQKRQTFDSEIDALRWLYESNFTA